jgi:hypothetical protein
MIRFPRWLRPVGVPPATERRHFVPKDSVPSAEALRSDFFGQGKPNVSANQTGVATNAAHTAQLVAAGYNNGKWGPLSIVEADLTQGDQLQRVYLVTISGTELVNDKRSGQPQATNWVSNIKLAYGFENEALKNARKVLLREVPAGSKLILAGHSQGGMVAQKLAADPRITESYQVLNTVTFGAPLVALGHRQGTTKRIAAFGDPVPRLGSPDEASDLWAIFGQQNIPSRFTGNNLFRGREAHANDYTDEGNQELQLMDALGRRKPEVPAVLRFDPGRRRFFTSPSTP